MILLLQKVEVSSVETKLKGVQGDADKIGKEKAAAKDKLHKISAELEGKRA